MVVTIEMRDLEETVRIVVVVKAVTVMMVRRDSQTEMIEITEEVAQEMMTVKTVEVVMTVEVVIVMTVEVMTVEVVKIVVMTVEVVIVMTVEVVIVMVVTEAITDATEVTEAIDMVVTEEDQKVTGKKVVIDAETTNDCYMLNPVPVPYNYTYHQPFFRRASTFLSNFEDIVPSNG